VKRSTPRRRELQKRRTRSALLAAAARLVAEGRHPSVAEVAEAADISRRTAYRYFPTQEQMLVEATLEALRPDIEGAIEPARPARSGERLAVRLDRTVRAVQRQTVANEALLRSMIRLTVEERGDRGAASAPPRPRRGYRRIHWIELALEPARAELGARRHQRLVAALALCVGIEALLVLRDICGLTAEDAERVSLWAARALLDASLERARSPRGLAARRRSARRASP
jgi:AcrR family transcriptional regulator